MLRIVLEARKRGLGVIFITHNVVHALTVGDHFAGSHSRCQGQRTSAGEKDPRGDHRRLMAGGEAGKRSLSRDRRAHKIA